jgi:hypothetical protein
VILANRFQQGLVIILSLEQSDTNMTKLTDVLKAALVQKESKSAPKAKKSSEEKVKDKSVISTKPVKKAAGRGR